MIKRIVRTVVVALAVTLSLTACTITAVTGQRQIEDTERLVARGFTDVVFLGSTPEGVQYEGSYGTCRVVFNMLGNATSRGVELANIDGVLSETDSQNVSAKVLDKYDYFNDCDEQASSTSSQEPPTDGL